jgi:tetratricopeptide (TPR) repeat protein
VGETGSLVGTPAFMSPEQCAGEPGRLGPRSDVYSLGATLYCILTGGPPFAGKPEEVLQAVRNGAYRRPRAVEPSTDAALEAICLKAMAKRPENRYPTPRALADDIERWAADEPVTAWREPFRRRAQRWAKRNRTAVVAVVATLIAGVIGLAAVAAVQDNANAALKRANKATRDALGQARAAEATARAEAEKATAINEFLTSDLLTQAEPAKNAAENHVTLLQVLDKAAAAVGKRFAGRPDLEASVRTSIADTYHGLGSWGNAEAQWRAVLALESHRAGSQEEAKALSSLAHILDHRGRAGEAIPLLERANDALTRSLGPDERATINNRGYLASGYVTTGRVPEAISLLEPTLKSMESKLGPDDPSVLNNRTSLAVAYQYVGRTSEAIELFESTLKRLEAKLGPDHPNTLTNRNNLGLTYHAAGRSAEAITLLQSTLKVRESKMGPSHPDTVGSRNSLGAVYAAIGPADQAIRLLEPTLKSRESNLGPDHPNTLSSRNNLATAYLTAGRTIEAIALLEATRKVRESKFGGDHPDTLLVRNNLATAYLAAGRQSDAIALHESTLQLRESKLGPNHPSTLISRNNLASAYEALSRWSEAEALRRAVVAQRRKTEKSSSPLLADDLAGLGRNVLKQSKWMEAEALLRECLASRNELIPDEWPRFDAVSLLGESLLGQGKHAEAEPLIVAGYQGMKTREAKIPAMSRYRCAEAASHVVQLYQTWGKPEQARSWAAKLGLADLPAEPFVQP